MARIDIEELARWVRFEGIAKEEDCLALLDELRAARAVVDAAHKVTDGAPEWYLKQRPWEANLAEALHAYDKLINDSNG